MNFNPPQGNVDFTDVGKTCAQLGMVANDSASHTSNHTTLLNALNEGVKILVDNKYFISGGTVYSSTGTVISEDIYFYGISENSEICFTNSVDVYWINPQCSNLIVKNLKFSTLYTVTSNYTWVFNFTNNQKLSSIIIEDNQFNGNMTFCLWRFTTYYDPLVTDYGVTLFKFNNNYSYNLKASNRGFLFFDTVPLTYAELINNTVYNFEYIFFSNGIDNVEMGNTHQINQAQYMKFLKVSNNIVINDVNWTGAPGTSEEYHCFILSEGYRTEYVNNYVEGLHVFDRGDELIGLGFDVCDAYLSCAIVLYEGNTWKNNIYFKTNKTYNDLFKSKSYQKSSYVGTERIYRNNTFILEDNYVNAINTANATAYDNTYTWINLISVENEIDNIIIENNLIDVYELKMNYALTVHHYEFNKNRIYACRFKDANNCILPIYTLTTLDNTDRYVACDNILIVDSAGTTANYYGYNFLITPKTISANGTNKVIFKDNYIEWPNLTGLFGNNVLTTIQTLDDVIMTGNTIKTTRPGSSTNLTLQFTQYCLIEKLIFDNQINIPVSTYKTIPSSKGGHISLDLHSKFKTFTDTGFPLVGVATNGIQQLLTSGVTYYNKVDLKCLHSAGYEDISFNFSHYYDSATSTACNCISFISTASSTGSLTGSTTITTILSGGETYNNYYVQLSGTASLFTIQFKNSGNDRGFYLNNSIPTDEYSEYNFTIKQTEKY